MIKTENPELGYCYQWADKHYLANAVTHQSAVTECTSLRETKSRLDGEFKSELHDLEEQRAGIVQIFESFRLP